MELQSYHSRLEALNTIWQERTENYAEAFRKNLAIKIGSAKRELEAVGERLKLAQKSNKRLLQLAVQGAASERQVEEALNQILQLEFDRTSLLSFVGDTEQRPDSSEDNVFLTSDGLSPEWAHVTDQLSLELAQAKKALAQAKSKLEESRFEAQSARELFERRSSGIVTVPAGNIVWSVSANFGETIGRGPPVLEWIDCADLLVDMPISDARIGLLQPGMQAQLLIEGESNVRNGSVLQTRGSSSKLGRKDLAAVAKGRHQESGQVMISLDTHPLDVDSCPVGRAAWVDIQDLSLMDVIMTRLRLRD